MLTCGPRTTPNEATPHCLKREYLNLVSRAGLEPYGLLTARKLLIPHTRETRKRGKFMPSLQPYYN
jgi:hypothetical protein